MKFLLLFILLITFFSLSACSLYYGKESASAPIAQSPKPLAMPIGENWQVIEEAPQLSDGNRLPFQTEQSVQPGGGKPVPPSDTHKIETAQ